MYTEVLFILFDYACERIALEAAVARLTTISDNVFLPSTCVEVLRQVREEDLSINAAAGILVGGESKKER